MLVAILEPVATFLLEVTLHAAYFLFLLLMALFSPRYREKLRQQWDTSARQKFGLVFGATAYVVALLIAGFFWGPLLLHDRDSATRREGGGQHTVEFTKEEMDTLRKTTDLDSIGKTAEDILRRKLAERDGKQVPDSEPDLGTPSR